MPFQFTCPYCFNKTVVEDSLAGQSGPCARCGKNVTLPSQSPVQHPPWEMAQRTAQAVPEYRRRRRILFGGVIVGAVAILLLSVGVYFAIHLPTSIPALQNLAARKDRTLCMNNLARIARALNNYADQYGSYPPAVVYDANGKPMHSWRALILEQLGEHEIHRLYNFEEPWDSTSNASLLGNRCPRVYISPASNDPRNSSETNYFLITGEGTLFPSSGPMARGDVTDGLANTLLVVEALNTSHEWSKPIDIDFAKLRLPIGSVGANTIGGTHNGGATAVFADGTPAWLSQEVAPDLIEALISPQGNEPVDPKNFYQP